jgi:cell division protein FtsQ
MRVVPPRMALAVGLSAATVAGLVGAGWHAQNSGLVGRLAISVESGFVSLSTATGLTVRDVLVEGRNRIEKRQLLSAMQVRTGDPILGIDLARMQARIAALAWVKQVRVERRLPDTVFVSLVEREPIALWQRDGTLLLIDRDGGVILRGGIERFATLPIVIGEDAPRLVGDFLDLLNSEPALRERVRAVTWVGARRWDVRVDGQISILLPEQDPLAAWSQLARLERDHGVLRRDVITVDMRLPDQLVVRVAPEAAARLRDRGRDT